MTVRMLTNIAGTPTYYSGQIVELEDRIATVWLKEGLAAPHRDERTETAAKK